MALLARQYRCCLFIYHKLLRFSCTRVPWYNLILAYGAPPPRPNLSSSASFWKDGYNLLLVFVEGTEQQIQDNNWNYHRTRAIRLTNGTRNVYLVGDLVRVVFREVSAAYRRIRKERKFENKLVVHYSPTISRVTEVVQPNDRTRFVVMYSIAVGGPDGLPPPVNTETWTMAADIPVLFTGNQLVPAGNTVSIAPRDEPRANYMNSRNWVTLGRLRIPNRFLEADVKLEIDFRRWTPKKKTMSMNGLKKCSTNHMALILILRRTNWFLKGEWVFFF